MLNIHDPTALYCTSQSIMAFNISSTTSDDDIFKSLEYASTVLKIDRFKDLQVDAIKSALKGQDVFVNLPTGYGKSVICSVLITSVGQGWRVRLLLREG